MSDYRTKNYYARMDEKEKARVVEEKEREAAPSQYNRYTRHLTDSRQQRLDDLAVNRELEKQRLLNQGQYDIADRQQTGGLAIQTQSDLGASQRTGMTEAGATKRTGMNETGATERTKMTEAGLATRADRLFESGQDENRLKLFEHLNQPDAAGGRNFSENLMNYNLFSMTPEARKALEERARNKLAGSKLAGEKDIMTSDNEDVSEEVKKRNQKNNSSFIVDRTQQEQNTLQAQNARAGINTSVLDRSPGWQRTKKEISKLVDYSMLTPEEYGRQNRY